MTNSFADALDFDATDQAELARRGDVHPTELVQAAIERVEADDGVLNAVIHRQFERALEEAAQSVPPGPFTGVPMIFKDASAEDAGELFCCGLAPARDAAYRSPHTTTIARTFRNAGFVPIGRSNTAELASRGTTEPLAFGPTLNPWNTERSPGGSSGGAGAAVGARFVAVGHAADIAGSIRIPAAHCGGVGLKPSRGHARADDVPVAIGMHTEGAIVRSVRDAAAIADLLAVPGSGTPLVDALKREPGPLTIGICTDAFNGVDVDPTCTRAVTDAGAALESAGHRLVAVVPDPLMDQHLHHAMKVAMAANTDLDLRRWSRRLDRELGEGAVEPETWAAIAFSRSLDPADLAEALTQLERSARQTAEWWRAQRLHILITPTTAEPPPMLDPTNGGYQPGRSSAFTRVFNATGQPAISLPTGAADDGLPRGVQLIGEFGRDDLVISAAALLERALPWADRRPVLAGHLR